MSRSPTKAAARAFFYRHIDKFEMFVSLQSPEMWDELKSEGWGAGPDTFSTIVRLWDDYAALLKRPFDTKEQRRELMRLSIHWLERGKREREYRQALERRFRPGATDGGDDQINAAVSDDEILAYSSFLETFVMLEGHKAFVGVRTLTVAAFQFLKIWRSRDCTEDEMWALVRGWARFQISR